MELSRRADGPARNHRRAVSAPHLVGCRASVPVHQPTRWHGEGSHRRTGRRKIIAADERACVPHRWARASHAEPAGSGLHHNRDFCAPSATT